MSSVHVVSQFAHGTISGGTPDSKIEDDDTADYHRRICLICGGTERQLSLFVLRAAEHLNGKLQHDLTMVHSTLLISKDQEGTKPCKNKRFCFSFALLFFCYFHCYL